VETICLQRDELLSLHTDAALQVIDITPRLEARAARAPVADGYVVVESREPSLALFLSDSRRTLRDAIDSLRMRLPTSLLGHALVIPVRAGRLGLDSTASVLAAELDGPRARAIRVHFVGS
jgi:thiamine phosphate synthase YjbQ (UPF0047 family)